VLFYFYKIKWGGGKPVNGIASELPMQRMGTFITFFDNEWMSMVIRLKVPIEMHYTVIPMETSKVNSSPASLTLALDCYSDHGTSSKLILNLPTVTELLNFTCQFLTSIYYNSHRRRNETEIVGCKQIRILYRPCKIWNQTFRDNCRQHIPPVYPCTMLFKINRRLIALLLFSRT